MAAGRKSGASKVIDVHNHPNWNGHDSDSLVANMDENGIDQTWLLSWEMPTAEFEAAPHYYSLLDPRAGSSVREAGLPLWMVVEALKRHPGRFIGGWAPDPRDRFARQRLKAAVDIHGIRIYGELKCRMRYDNPDAIAMFRFCAELGLPVLFHLEAPAARMRRLWHNPKEWVEWYGGGMDAVDTMCRLCPDTRFIGHGPGFWREISSEESDEDYPSGPVKKGGALVRALREHANLYADLSAGSGCKALSRDLKHARVFIEEFQDRVLFGRDCFTGALRELLGQLELPKTVTAKVFAANAQRLVRSSLSVA